MNDAASSAASAPRVDPQVIEALALEIQAPTELVQRAFEEEWLALKQNARITQFLTVIASRKVRMRMRKH